MSLPKQILVCLVIALAALGGWYLYADACTPDAGATALGQAGGAGAAPGGRAARIPGLRGRGGATNVIVAAVATDTTGDLVRAIGTARAAKSVTIYPPVSGIVAEIAFTPGAPVAAGDLLARLENDEQAVALESARLALAQAEETLGRSRKLAGSKTISGVALSDAQSAADQARIQMKTAEIALARRSIAAPFAGTTGLTDVSAGDFVTSSDPITMLSDLDDMRVAFEVPERWAGRISTGTPISARTAGAPGDAFDGAVTAIDNQVDETTRTLKMEATLDNSAGILKPGMAVDVSMQFRSDERLAVPSLSVQWDREGAYVWKVADGAAARADIVILSRQAGIAIVRSEALSEGEMVVTEGVQRLRPGAKVAVLNEGDGGETLADAPAAAPNS